jgi:hypothetical protein
MATILVQHLMNYINSYPITLKLHITSCATKLCSRWGWAPRSRLAGADSKPPKAAVVKSHGGERLGKVTAETVAGMAKRDERKRTIDEASKISLTRSKLGSDVRSRMSLG